MAEILNGKKLSRAIQTELAERISAFAQESGVVPKLAAILVGDDPASQVYVRNKQRACKRAGIASELFRMNADTSEQELLDTITKLNESPSVHGLLVQLPLPNGINEQRVLDAVSPLKDVDAFHPENVGLISQERPRFLPCTPHGVIQILHRNKIDVVGKHVVIVGRSNIVGRPLAMMMSLSQSNCGAESCNATVTVCHSKTKDLASFTRQADVLVAAVGRPKFISKDMIKAGAVVIDVGINRTEEGLVGDVDFDGASEVASYITPVPGGVGPMTVTMLLENTLTAAKLQSNN